MLHLTREQVRSFDHHAIETLGVPSLTLMENAGRGAAEVLLSLGIHGPVLVCCGKGNNGGDGLVIARHLLLHGVVTRIWVFARPEEMSIDAAANYRILERRGVPMTIADDAGAAFLEECSRAEWIVDALFGTGLTGAVRVPLDKVIATINASTGRVFAVDIPSGLDCDTGKPLVATPPAPPSKGGEKTVASPPLEGGAGGVFPPTIRATHTATFVAPKTGYANPEAFQWTGKVHVVPIGIGIE